MPVCELTAALSIDEKYLVRVEEKLFDDVPREARVGHVDFRPLVGDDVGRW